MWPIAAHVACSVVCVSALIFGTAVHDPAKTAGSMEMPFEGQVCVGPKNHILLAPPGECDGNIGARRLCGLMSNYFHF